MSRDTDRPGDADPLDAVDIPALLSQLREERTDHLIRIVTEPPAEADPTERR